MAYNLSYFSGSDIMVFIDGKYRCETMSVKLGKEKARMVFALSDEAFKMANKGEWMLLYLVGLCELGNKAILKGVVKPYDFEISTSIDELSTEITVDFESFVAYTKGFFEADQEELEEVNEIYAREVYPMLIKEKK